MSTVAPEPVLLSQDQADRILQFAIENRMYESGADGLEAVDPATRLQDAATLAFQAKRAFANGNDSENVKEVLFIAEVDMTAPGASNGAAAQAPAASPTPASPPADEYASNSTEQLQEALNVFRNSADNPAVQAEIAKIEAVLQQRNTSAQTPAAPQPAQEVPTPAAPPAPASAPATSPPVSPGQPSAAIPPAPAAGVPEPHVPAPHADLPPVPGRPSSGVISPGGLPDGTEVPPAASPQPPASDAGALPGDQAPQPAAQGQLPAAQAPAQGGGREELLKALTWEMMSAYGLTVEAAQQLSDDQLRSIIANPSGPAAAPTAVAVPSPASTVSPEREQLEAQISGPMLKAWGRGRKQVPDLSDDDLRTMVANPKGPSTVEQAPVGSPPQPAQPTAPIPAAAPAAPPSPEPAAPAAPSSPPTPPAPVARPASDAGQVSEAMAIIQREHLPIPPDIEEPYRLPNDASQLSDNDLRSLHARAHAVEARCNWILAERDDVAADYERLIKDQIRIATEALPETEEGKKLTKVRKEELIAADPELIRLRDELKKHERETSKIKVIRDNAHRDCERMSRQFTMRYREEMGVVQR